MQEQFRCIVVPGEEIARGLGNAKCMNVVMFGAASTILETEGIDWEAVVAETVPAKLRDLNVAAFRAGAEAAKG